MTPDPALAAAREMLAKEADALEAQTETMPFVIYGNATERASDIRLVLAALSAAEAKLALDAEFRAGHPAMCCGQCVEKIAEAEAKLARAERERDLLAAEVAARRDYEAAVDDTIPLAAESLWDAIRTARAAVDAYRAGTP